MNARPLVGVHEDGSPNGVTISLPAIFRAPIRPDVVNFIHCQISKNSRQPYAVSKKAGKDVEKVLDCPNEIVLRRFCADVQYGCSKFTLLWLWQCIGLSGVGSSLSEDSTLL